jgi:hypothetical protein
MKILAIARLDPQTTPAKMQLHLEAEVKHAWKLYKEGVLREAYDRPDRRGVVFVLECGGVEEARKALAGLPFVGEGLIDFELIPLGPFAYFEGLFRDAQK